MILIILTGHKSTENNEVSITHRTRVRPISFYESGTILVGLVLSINIVQKHVTLQSDSSVTEDGLQYYKHTNNDSVTNQM
jgi:hypothetical protein